MSHSSKDVIAPLRTVTAPRGPDSGNSRKCSHNELRFTLASVNSRIGHRDCLIFDHCVHPGCARHQHGILSSTENVGNTTLQAESLE
ncbi:unnamed protein product [Leptosia nina]|uniref:Uncharacterized protein n=1 Tax=Leptosia nina TaxID=320188 RepID=A0AAV1JQI5_9NEOP